MMANVLSKAKINAIWLLFKVSQSNPKIAKTLGINPGTVNNYTKLPAWIKRKKNLIKKAQTHNDNLDAKRLAKQLRTASRMQGLGNNYFYNKKGKLRKGIKKKMKPKDALTAMKDGVMLERIILGQDNDQDNTPRQINVIYVYPDKKKKRKRIESEVIESE